MNATIADYQFKTITYDGETYMSRSDLVGWILECGNLSGPDLMPLFNGMAKMITEAKICE